jgi:hypothetical protein
MVRDRRVWVPCSALGRSAEPFCESCRERYRSGMASIARHDDGFWIVYEKNELQLQTDYVDGPHRSRADAEAALEGITRSAAASRSISSGSDRLDPSERSITD